MTGNYDDAFYSAQLQRSLASARVMLGALYTVYQPKSVIDVGCGRGAWLAVCGELGAATLKGIDGPWNNAAHMLDPKIDYSSANLDAFWASTRTYDLAVSLEVGEHLEPTSAATLVSSLTKLSDVVLFGAAVPGQGGTHHVNEQYQSYWGSLFKRQGFQTYDFFRPLLWNDERIAFWYRQNTFLHVRQGHALFDELQIAGHLPLSDLGFMDCIHPLLYEKRIREGLDALTHASSHMGVREHLADLVPSLVRAVRYRLHR